MIVCVDVDYRDPRAVAAAVVLPTFTAEAPSAELTVAVDAVAAYEPGAFYRRELPCLLQLVAALPQLPACIVVDGHAWLGHGHPGLGAHLHEALRDRYGATIAVVGVAKTAWHDGSAATEVVRGFARPLYVSAVGMDGAIAADHVRSMHGEHRLPTALKRVDRLCRDTPWPGV